MSEDAKQVQSVQQNTNENASNLTEYFNINDDSLGVEQKPSKGKTEEEKDSFSFIPEDDELTRQYIEDKNWKNPDEVITAFQDFERTMDDRFKETLAPPDRFASKDEINTYGRTIGRPDNPEGYDIPYIENFDEEARMEFLDLCHYGLMNQLQADRYIEAMTARDRKIREENRNIFKQERIKLVSEWGDKKDYNEKMLREGIKALKVPTENLNELQKQIGPRAFAEMMIALGKKNAELGSAPTSRQFRNHYPTKASAERQLNEFKNDLAWTKRYLAGDEKAIQEHDMLNTIIAKE